MTKDHILGGLNNSSGVREVLDQSVSMVGWVLVGALFLIEEQLIVVYKFLIDNFLVAHMVER